MTSEYMKVRKYTESEISIWIKDNIELFNGLEKGKMYVQYEGEGVVPLEGNKPIQGLVKINGRNRSVRVSPNTGGLKLMRLALCKCGKKKAGPTITTPWCRACYKAGQRELSRKWYWEHKNDSKETKKKRIKTNAKVSSIYTDKPKPRTARSIAAEITGEYERVKDRDRYYYEGWSLDPWDEINIASGGLL